MKQNSTTFFILLMALLGLGCGPCCAQGALLMEEPYGFFGTLNPTGHTAIYLDRVCAETPVKLRPCEGDEPGAVIARYQGIAGYDWIAIPLLPYLYAVDDADKVPERVDRATVVRLRDHYRETHLESLGDQVDAGGFLHGGWTQLAGVAYERRIYAFRFQTTAAEDDAFIAAMNAGPNRSHFNLLFNNCADFARAALDRYFPHTFGRSIFPDAGMMTPKQLSHKLVKYARKHPEVELEVFEIAQVPGYRRQSRSNKSIAESLITTGYAVPIVLLNPYIAGGLLADYLVRGRFHVIPDDPLVILPDNLSVLTGPAGAPENPDSAAQLADGAAASVSTESRATETALPGLARTKALDE